MTPRPYRCLVVDDEPIARKILRNYIEQMPNLDCVGECKNAFEAIEQIHADETIDIVFLDIHMPNLSGLAMVKILSRKLQVVFTTAHSEFAVESYDLDAVDYLLKPFLFERFAKSVFKAVERLKTNAATDQMPDQQLAAPVFYLKSDGENHPVQLSEILYCEAMKNYTKVVLQQGKTYYPLVAISKLEADLARQSTAFMRIHRSYLISKNHLGAVGANYVMIEQHKIPIGHQYKEEFLTQLKIK